MKKTAALSLILLLSLLIFSPFPNNAQVLRPIGTNLAGPEDYNEEYIFVDAFKQSREWIPHEYGWAAPWTSGVHIPLRADGYPVEIPYDNGVDPLQAIRTVLFCGDLNDRYPGGYYRLMASGQGQIRLRGPATGTFQCPVDTLVWVDSTLSCLMLEIDTSLVTDPVRDIHFIMPGFHQTWEEQVFHPHLLEFLADFQVIRFMDWMKTNFSPVETWTDRTPLNYYSQTLPTGVAYEHIIDLCNRLHKDPWICIPHQADDNFMTEIARLFRDSLDPCLKIYVEYSNELWNGIFSQSQYATQQGASLGYNGQPWEQGWKFTAKRSADLFGIFENEFSDHSRLVKVIPSGINGWVSNYIMDRFSEPLYNPTGVTADAIAIAPYFGGAVADDIGNAGLINTISVSGILDSLEASLSAAFNFMDETRTVADSHQVMLLAYEGGQHLVANNIVYQNDTAYIRKLQDANRHPRMENMYCEYFNYWYDSTGGDLFAHFSSHGNWSKYGSWGVKEYYEDYDSPKYLGLLNCVFNHNQIDPPIAVDDLDTLLENTAICVPILENDLDPNGDSIHIGSIVLSPSHGTAFINLDSICYTPDPGFSGLDSLWYLVCDGDCENDCDTGRVMFWVTADTTVNISHALETKAVVYPNPARQAFTVEHSLSEAKLRFFNLQGKEIPVTLDVKGTGSIVIGVNGFYGMVW